MNENPLTLAQLKKTEKIESIKKRRKRDLNLTKAQ